MLETKELVYAQDESTEGEGDTTEDTEEKEDENKEGE